MNKNHLKAGFAREDITPEIGTALYGYKPDNFSESLHDPLAVNAICFEKDGLRVMLLDFDLCLISNDLTAEIQYAVERETGIPHGNVILCATHTHSGPNVGGEKGWGDIDHKYADEIMKPKALAAAKAASATLVEVSVGIGTTESRVGMNRRMVERNGDVVLGQNPWGPFDPTMTVVVFKKISDGKPLCNMIHYGCHGTACGCTTEITRDWYGVMIDRLEELSGAPTFFVNAAEGDVGPRITNGWTGGGMDYVMELGGIASRDAIDAWRTIKEYRECPEMKILSGEIKLPYRDLPPLEYCEAEIAKVEHPEELINIFFLEYQHMVDVKEVYDKHIPKPDFFKFRQTILAIGPILFVPLPYEFFSEIQMRIRQYSPYAYTLCMSNANGSNGYFPTKDAIAKGGYEVKSFISGDAFTLTDDADQHLIDAELELIEKL